ncbi:MAG: hypothetical protein GXP17_11525 [Gammaproteobacteria bacterium]|nr:hypothetical protein [Gammaproteobacteria bacterium]
MPTESKFRSIKLVNVHNHRSQFFNHYHMVKSDDFARQIESWQPDKPVIETPYLSWYYWPSEFFTFLTQLSIIGLESYVIGAVYEELGIRGVLNEHIKYLKKPRTIPGARGLGTAGINFNLMPALISDELSLKNVNVNLWEEIELFYKEIRNQIFHGMQLDTQNLNEIIPIFELLADVYEWIDSWHNPNDVIPGSDWFTKLDRA